jgi:hypothetical protein
MQLLAGAALGLVLLACGDATGSVTEVNTAASALGAAKGGANAGDPQLIAMKPGAPPLVTTQASFWAVQGRRTGVAIHYRPAAQAAAGQPFLQFTVPAKAQLVDPTGRWLARGDSILIDVKIVPGQLEARFLPCGLVFAGKTPAELSISYLYGDLPVNPARQLAIWYRPLDDAPWEQQRSRIDRQRIAVVADISHFSNYAVAY